MLPHTQSQHIEACRNVIVKIFAQNGYKSYYNKKKKKERERETKSSYKKAPMINKQNTNSWYTFIDLWRLKIHIYNDFIMLKKLNN